MSFSHAKRQHAYRFSRRAAKTFAFDHCFNSYLDPGCGQFASQETVFNSLGTDILENAFDGYNACIFAYGQTGAVVAASIAAYLPL